MKQNPIMNILCSFRKIQLHIQPIVPIFIKEFSSHSQILMLDTQIGPILSIWEDGILLNHTQLFNIMVRELELVNN